MIEEFKIELNAKLYSSDRYPTYIKFKLNLNAEKYLNQVTIKKFRDALIRMRLGLNDLGINKRFNQTNPVTKNCKFCTSVTEEECHFLFDCPAYDSIRTKYLTPVLNQNANADLTTTLGNTNTNDIRKIAMYIYYAMECRNELLDVNQP